ncbi:kinetochore-associated Ndc80 complex subunit spc25 [Xylographa carneopallida]|nr:kinetochore-associated Ndc80 complex subunit spc25 [Xylographa carneopallida]
MFEPSLSTTTRAPLSSASALSMADSLPSINFGFEELRERMARFSHRFDDFIAEGRKRVLEERNQFRMNVAELHGKQDQRMKRHAIEILSQKSSTHTQNLAKEAAETSEMYAAISSITSQRDIRSAQRDRLRAEITSVQKTISQRLDAQRQHAAYLDAQARHNVPELDFWQDYLCLRIEGAGMIDRLKFVFTHVNERDWDREAWFELCTESRDYQVMEMRPKVEKEKIGACVDRLNENRNLGMFLKGVRELFVEVMK